MSITFNPSSVVPLLAAIQMAQRLPTPDSRAGAYITVLSSASHEELVGFAAVLAEGNAFGADAARRMAGVA